MFGLPHPLAQLVVNLDTHVALTEADRALLLALPHTVRDVAAGTYIVREGEVPGACAILTSGFAYRQKISEEGARQVISIHLPGEPLDLQHLQLDCADHNVQALTEARIAFVPRQALRDLNCQSAAVGKALAVATLVEASITREWMLNIGRRNGLKRLAHLLCEFSVRLERLALAGTYGYVLPMSQEWLGDALGLTPVHVNRLIRTLVEGGFITRDKRCIRFPDWNAMRRVAGFNDRYLHLLRQQPA